MEDDLLDILFLLAQDALPVGRGQVVLSRAQLLWNGCRCIDFKGMPQRNDRAFEIVRFVSVPVICEAVCQRNI